MRRSNPFFLKVLDCVALLAMTFFLLSPALVYAQEDDFDQRMALATEMLKINPAQDQLANAVDIYIKNYMFAYPQREQEIFRTAMLEVLNPQALEKISIDAYAETFTREELEAMVEYYSRPEAKSARLKEAQLNAKIAPEMTRMLDQALMRVRTAIKQQPQ